MGGKGGVVVRKEKEEWLCGRERVVVWEAVVELKERKKQRERRRMEGRVNRKKGDDGESCGKGGMEDN